MTTLTRLSFISLVAFATLTGCGGGGGGGGGGAATAPVAGAGDVVIDDLIFGLPPSPVVSTSFEFTAIGGFVIGTSPFTADFSNGNAETRGNQDLYSTGDFAWHILNATSATVTFETPATTLSFWVRTENAADVSSIEIFDDAATSIMTVTPTTTFQQITVIRTAGETPIGSMVVTN